MPNRDYETTFTRIVTSHFVGVAVAAVPLDIAVLATSSHFPMTTAFQISIFALNIVGGFAAAMFLLEQGAIVLMFPLGYLMYRLGLRGWLDHALAAFVVATAYAFVMQFRGTWYAPIVDTSNEAILDSLVAGAGSAVGAYVTWRLAFRPRGQLAPP